jgi:hypothetical protein
MKHPQHHLPTTTVQAYVATDGSLWLNEDECLERNQELSSELHEHIYHRCFLDDTSCYTTETIAEYIIEHFDKIKTILGK